MAKSVKTASSSGNFKNSKKALPLLLAILLIASLCYGDCLDVSGMFEASSTRGGRSLLENPKNKQSAMKISEEKNDHKNPTAFSATTAGAAAGKDRQFGMAAHDVPSGPNPESN